MESKSPYYFCGFFLAGYNILMISSGSLPAEPKRRLSCRLSRSVIWPPILIAVLPLFFGSESIWFCHSIGEALTACTAFILLSYNHHRERLADVPLQ